MGHNNLAVWLDEHMLPVTLDQCPEHRVSLDWLIRSFVHYHPWHPRQTAPL